MYWDRLNQFSLSPKKIFVIGIDMKARIDLEIPDNFDVMATIAVGKRKTKIIIRGRLIIS